MTTPVPVADSDSCEVIIENFTLDELVDLALCSPEVGAVNFNILRILLHEMLKKLGGSDQPINLNDNEAHQISNFKSYIQGAGTASPMPGVLRYAPGTNQTTNSAKTPRTGHVEQLKPKSAPAPSSSRSTPPAQQGGQALTQAQALALQHSIGVVYARESNVNISPEKPSSGNSRTNSGPDSSMETKVARLERELEALYALPTNAKLLGQEQDKDMSVNDMWQIIQLNNRVAAAEAAIQKMASLIEDLAKQIKILKTDTHGVRKDSQKVAKTSSEMAMQMEPCIEKCEKTAESVARLQADLEKIKAHLIHEIEKLSAATGVDVTNTPSFMQMRKSATSDNQAVRQMQQPTNLQPQAAALAQVKKQEQKPGQLSPQGQIAQPIQAQPVQQSIQSGSTQHQPTQQGTVQPVYTQPQPTQPGYAQPQPTQPGHVQPQPTQAGYTQPPPIQPGYTQPQPGQPGYTQPSQPAYTQSQPGQPGSSQNQTVQSGYTQNQPAQSGYPQNQPIQPGYPQNQPGQPGYPQNQPIQPGYTQNQPGQLAYSQTQHHQPGNIQNRPGPAMPMQTPLAQPGYSQNQPGPPASTQNQYAQPGYPPSAAGQSNQPGYGASPQLGPNGQPLKGDQQLQQFGPTAPPPEGVHTQSQQSGYTPQQLFELDDGESLPTRDYELQATGGGVTTSQFDSQPFNYGLDYANPIHDQHREEVRLGDAHPDVRHQGISHVPMDVSKGPLELIGGDPFQKFRGPMILNDGVLIHGKLDSKLEEDCRQQESIQQELQQQYARLQEMQRQMSQEIQDKMELVYQKLLREISNQHATTSPYMAVGLNAEKCMGPGVCSGFGLPPGTAICQFPQNPEKVDICKQDGKVFPVKDDILHHLRVPGDKARLAALDLPKPGLSSSKENLLRQLTSMTLLPRDLEDLREKIKQRGTLPDVFDEMDVLEKLQTVWEAVNVLKNNEENMAVRLVQQDAILKKIPDSLMGKLEDMPGASQDKLGLRGEGRIGKMKSLKGLDSEDMQLLFNNLSSLVLENTAMKDKLQKFSDLLLDIEQNAVTKPMLMSALGDKADRGAMNTKVSYDEFGSGMDELQSRLGNLLQEVYRKNELWKEITDNMREDLDEKLDKVEIGPLRAYFKNHLGKLEERVNCLTKIMQEPDPAGTRKKLLKDYNCLSCDRHTNISGITNASLLPSFGPILAGHSRASKRAFELYRMRPQASRYDTEGRNFCQIEGQGRGDGNNNETNESSMPLNDSDILHLVNRYAGGSHTTISIQERLAALHKRASVSGSGGGALPPKPNLPTEVKRPSTTTYYNDE